MGAGASTIDEAPSSPTPLSSINNNNNNNIGEGNHRRSSAGERITFSTSWNERRKRSKALKQNEAAVMKFIKKNVSAHGLTVPLVNIIGVSTYPHTYSSYTRKDFSLLSSLSLFPTLQAL